MDVNAALQREIAGEQGVADSLYSRLDAVRERTSTELEHARNDITTGTPASRVEREAFVRMYADRLAALLAAEERLVFGRLDLEGGDIRHIGRVGLADDSQVPLLTDWRAPAAEAFYQATGAHPMAVVRRRHIVTRGRTVTGVEDDVLNIDHASDVEVLGSGALLAALGAKRTGRMHDIVATIQAEQDRIIRSQLGGVLVVEGGPGCGKTVVALHRAAFLLYTHRDRLQRNGVLVVGPNPLFLRYIEQVLPALGETAAVLVSMSTLLPDVVATAVDSDEVAAIKGDIRMAEAVRRAVRRRQRVPERGIELDVHGTRIVMTPAMVTASRDRARADHRPHNVARRTFVISLLDRLATALADARNQDRDNNYEILIEDLRSASDVRREVNLCWMPLTPERLLAEFLADVSVLRECAKFLSPKQAEALVRPLGSAWTQSDVPLLDEAADLLGSDGEEERRLAALASAERRVDLEYAQGVLEMTGMGEGVTADQVVDRYSAERSLLSVAERAAGDREWAYGHVVVDEAQELTPMAWRSIMRRCPSRSMTIVGDLAQASSAVAPRSWGAALEGYCGDRWRVESLTVNYRTPQPVMALAEHVLRASGEGSASVQSVREGDEPFYGPADSLVEVVRREAAAADVGRMAVLVAERDREAVAALLAAGIGDALVGAGLQALDREVSVLTVRESKGLEFDVVVLFEPDAMVASSGRPGSDLYVAITRTTQRLHILHSRALPPGFLH